MNPSPADPSDTLVELPALRLARWLADLRRLGGTAVAWHICDGDTDRVRVLVSNLPLALRLAIDAEGPDFAILDPASQPMTAESREIVEVRAPERREADTAVPPALSLPPRLRRHSRIDTPTLWAIRGEALAAFARIVREMDETQMLVWQFAVGSHGGRLRVILRPAHRRRPPTMFLPDVPAYVAHRPVASLFLPAGTTLMPQPRADALRAWLGVRPDRVYWLDERPQGIAVESIPESAFRPLREWVVWKTTVAPRAATAWTDRTGLLLPEAFRIGLPPREAPASNVAPASAVEKPLASRKPPKFAPDAARGPSRWRSLLVLLAMPGMLVARLLKRSRQPEEVEPPSIDLEAAVRTAIAPLADRLDSPEIDDSPGKARLSELENVLIRRLDVLTPAESSEIWPALAAAYHRADNHADSAICSLLALWDHRTLREELTWGWFRSEATQASWNPHHVDLARRLPLPATPATVRALAAWVVWTVRAGTIPDGVEAHLPTVRRLLEDGEEHLTIRAIWLVRLALSRAGGGDVLDLARTRDRLLDRLLREGLRPDRDIPSCLGAGSSNIDRYRLVRSWLSDHREPIQQWISRQARPGSAAVQTQFGLEAETKFTSAYADLMLCWGLTRLSDYPTADRLRVRALRVLSVEDPVHSLLRDMWLHRIDRAREQTADPSFPEPLLQRLEKLPQTLRYSVEKMLEHSRILEPTANRNAYRPTVTRYGRTELERNLNALSEERDDDRLRASVREILGRTSVEQMAMAIPLLLDLGGRLGEIFRGLVYPQAMLLLDNLATPSAVRQIVLERGMLTAAACDQPELVRELADWLARYLTSRPGGSLAPLEMLSERLLRCLRRLGMKIEMSAIVDGAAKAVLRGYGPARVAEFHPTETPLALRLLVLIAGGWYSCGAVDRANVLLDHVRGQWQQSTSNPAEKTRLALEYARVLGGVPAGAALVRMQELFATLGRIQSTGSTNRYYTLRVLEMVETVVLSVVSDEFALGPMVRGWLDDEEFLIRQRIAADLQGLLIEQGIV